MNRTRGRLLVACLALIGAVVAVAGGSAGNRDGIPTFTPSPAIVTYGEDVAYNASLDNNNASGSIFTHVTYEQTRPVATFGSTKYPAELLEASCDAVIDDKGDLDQTNDVLRCEFDALRPEDEPIRLTTLWSAPVVPLSPNCDSCLTSTATWRIKEGKQTNGNETFTLGPPQVTAALLGGQGTPEDKKAGGYETAGIGAQSCTAATGNLRTNQSLTKNNPFSTTVCLPAFTIPDEIIDFGYASTIVETLTPPEGGAAHPELGQSIVCVAALGWSCVPNHVPANWGTVNKARHIFRILDSALTTVPKEITSVTHNGFTLPPCAGPGGNPNYLQGCVVSITPPSGNVKFWIVVVDAPTNGPYGF